jgi:hypothetical protein
MHVQASTERIGRMTRLLFRRPQSSVNPDDGFVLEHFVQLPFRSMPADRGLPFDGEKAEAASSTRLRVLPLLQASLSCRAR